MLVYVCIYSFLTAREFMEVWDNGVYNNGLIGIWAAVAVQILPVQKCPKTWFLLFDRLQKKNSRVLRVKIYIIITNSNCIFKLEMISFYGNSYFVVPYIQTNDM